VIFRCIRFYYLRRGGGAIRFRFICQYFSIFYMEFEERFLLLMALATFNIVDSHVRPFYELQKTFRCHGYVSHSHYVLIYILTEEKPRKKLISVRAHARNSKITDILGVVSHKGTLFWIYCFSASRPV
jgi:hypothetical protein